MNSISILGRLTKEVELKQSKGGKDFFTNTIAVKRKFSDESDFINIVAFGKTAEIISKYVKKGQQLGITGRLEINSKKEGDKFTSFTNVIIDDITFVEKKEKKVVDPFEVEEPKTETKPDNKSFSDLFNGFDVK